MATTNQRIFAAAALELEPAERDALAEELMLSLPPIDPGIEKAWLEEAKRRYATYEAGEMTAKPVEEVLDRISRKRRP